MNEEPTATDSPSPATNYPSPGDKQVGLLDLLIVLAKHNKLILGVPFAAAIVAAIVSLLSTPIYTGVTKILPPQQSQSSTAALLGQLGGLAGTVSASLGIKNPADLYVGMLQSRTIADRLTKRFELQTLYDAKTLFDARKQLAEKSNIKAGKDGIITIEVDDKDPKRAAAMANAYVEELDRLSQTLAVTEAAQRRLFFEKQLKQAKDNLAEAEVELKKTQEHTGLIKLDEQGRTIIEAVANLRAQVAVKEVQLATMRSFATERNPEYARVQQELAGLRGELLKLEKTNAGGQGDIFVPTGKVPELALQYVRKLREVKYHETLFELLAKHFELAKADEAKDSWTIQVIDKAVEPDKRTRPKRTQFVILAALAAGLLATVVAFLKELLATAAQNPRSRERIHQIRRYLRWRRH